MHKFQGLTEDTYNFFWEIAFQNNQSFFHANRERFRNSVQLPLLQLASDLAPYALDIDPDFQVRPSSVVSRIRRDTRYSKDKSPFRDHMWLGYKYPSSYTSENFVVYVEFERESFGYGMGMYAPNPAMMQEIRGRILARSDTFLTLVNDRAFSDLFQAEGETFKRPKYTEQREDILPWLNLRRLAFCYSSPELSRTLRPEITDEIIEAFRIMKPVYRFIIGLD
ncbi:MAG: DUF2461 domain-containing protein [Clostridia bacterium]|nr:DUF2461 domain-containing protein [Clostridia bacterium]